jgi:hypothetical protein
MAEDTVVGREQDVEVSLKKASALFYVTFRVTLL